MESKKFVVGVLCHNGEYLAEKRHASDEHFAGMVIFPGGRIEEGETAELALIREMVEELGVEIKKYFHLRDFVYYDGFPLSVFAVTEWEGEPKALEAESILWVRNENKLSDELNKEIFRLIKSRHGK